MPIKFAISIPFTVFAISLFYIVSTFLPTCRAVAIDNRTPSDSIDLVPVGNPKPSLSSSDDNSSNDSDDSDENTRLSSGPDRLFAYPTLAYPYNTTHWSLELEVGVFGPHFIPAGFIKKQLKLFVGMSTKEEEAIATARLRSSWVTGRSGFKVPVDVSFGKDRFGKDIIMQDVLDLPSNQYGSSKDIMYVPNDIIDHFLRRGVTALSYNATGTIRVAKSSKSLIARVGEIKEDVDELLDFDNDDDDSDDERLDDHAAPTAFPNSVFLVPYNGVSVVSDIDDTIKISEVLSKTKLIYNTFCKPHKSTPGIADLYYQWQHTLPNSSFHYLSGSPYQFLPIINEFFQSAPTFPAGTIHLKKVNLGDFSAIGDLSSEKTFQHKTQVLKFLFGAFPRRKFIFVGDSTEMDPEVYAQFAKYYPNQVLCVLIRLVTGVKPDEEAHLNSAERFEKTFEGVSKLKWKLFSDVKEDGLMSLDILNGQCGGDN